MTSRIKLQLVANGLLLLTLVPRMSWQQQTPSCYRRQCDQLIVGRQLRYERALEIINNEEYLTAADQDLVRRRRRRSRLKRQITSYGDGQDDNEYEDKQRLGSFNYTQDYYSVLVHIWNCLILGANCSSTNQHPKGPEVSLGTVVMTTGIVSLGSLIYLTLPPGPELLVPPPGVAPPGVPQPGQPGGGAQPVANEPTAAEALSLTPAGTVPVAIFPPFLTPRTLRAVAVIFSETQPTYEYDGHSRFHQQFTQSHAKRRQWRKRKQRSVLHRMGRFLDIVFQKRQVMRRKFGFAVKVTLVDEMCQLDVTCDINGQSLNNAAQRRQTGEEFSSTAPPDCRTIFVGCTP